MAYVLAEQPDWKNKEPIFACYRAACAVRQELESGGLAFDLFTYPEIGAESQLVENLLDSAASAGAPGVRLS